jgi:hypothetical protein
MILEQHEAERIVRAMLPLAGLSEIVGYAGVLRRELANLDPPSPPLPAGTPIASGTAFLKFRVTDESLGAIRSDVEQAILDGVRRALGRVELAADQPDDPSRIANRS